MREISASIKAVRAVVGQPGVAVAAPLKLVAGYLLLATVMAGAIAWRVASRPDTPSLWPILLWQMAVWLPWIGYFYAIQYLSLRIAARSLSTAAKVAIHALAVLSVAASHLVWYWQVSDLGSPLKGLPDTRYGVYAFFFVFWFLFDLLLYLAVLVGLDRRLRDAPAQPAAEPRNVRHQTPDTCRKQFAVRKGRARHVVRAEDIRWIEAQGYYAALHTESGSYLIRRSLAKLEKELDPERFVRIHRSTIVNVANISAIKTDRNGATSVLLTHGGRRRISRTGYQNLKARLQPLA